MTVHAEIPVIEYEGNGITTDYSFTWSSGDPSEIYALLDGVELEEGIEYELEEYTLAYGGTLVFNEAPASGQIVRIFRDTPVTQELDYVDGDAFPAETHEFQCDKDTRILQEIIEGGRAVGGKVDLSADQQAAYTDIVNSSGTDARIVPWTTDGLASGVAIGEVIPDGGTPPTDSAPTSALDGYIWWVLGPAAAAGGDAAITMFTDTISVLSQEVAPDQARAEFAYIAADGEIGYGYDQTLPFAEPVWTTETAMNPAVTASGAYWVQMTQVTGTLSGSAVDTWLDASLDASWRVNNTTATGIFTIAPDDGGGSPDMGLAIARNINLTAEQS